MVVTYQFRQIRPGNDLSKVALILSLSGTIRPRDLPPDIDRDFFLYEITLADAKPNPAFLRTRRDLAEFKSVYQLSLRTIMRDHVGLDTVRLFPAVPAPIAVLCGRELLPKVDPTLRVYDNNKSLGGFVFTMEVN
jgi:hypothetical protein